MSEERYRPCGADGCCYTDDKKTVESLRAENERLRSELSHIINIGQMYQLSKSDVEDAEALLSTQEQEKDDES